VNLSPGVASAAADRKPTLETSTSKETPALPQKLDVNRATREELLSVPGIGPGMAQDIVDLRVKKNSFTKIEELLEVRGIKKKKLASLTRYLAIVPLQQSGAATQTR
jgi:competence protein ComEA